ncbi:hypothetical protein HZ326_15523 [Fusarium oxysporum f. sp. albedinis]|nr:hypothetical protein HZ326_15523 [Fusarium oxysporum f. sp. albedinis]
MNAWMFLEPFDISRFPTMRTHRSRYRESPSAVLPSASWSYLQLLWRRGPSVGQNIVHANVTFSATLTCHYTRQPQIIKCDFPSSRLFTFCRSFKTPRLLCMTLSSHVALTFKSPFCSD